jgi:hypothetical protein
VPDLQGWDRGPQTPLEALRAASSSGGPGLAVVALSVVEQRLDAVCAVLAGAKVTEAAESVGEPRQRVHAWLARNEADGLPGLADHSHRPQHHPWQTGRRRRSADLRPAPIAQGVGSAAAARAGLKGVYPLPSRSTVHRVLVREHLVEARPRKPAGIRIGVGSARRPEGTPLPAGRASPRSLRTGNSISIAQSDATLGSLFRASCMRSLRLGDTHLDGHHAPASSGRSLHSAQRRGHSLVESFAESRAVLGRRDYASQASP